MELLKGKVSVVTGAAGGIGEALALALAARGSRVALVDISLERAQAVAQTIGDSARSYSCDVSDLAKMQALATQIQNDFGVINQVFVNAGVAVGGKLTQITASDFQWLFDVNVRGSFNTITAFTPALLEQAARQDLARFVFTGSENSVGLPDTAEMTAYTATKHALLGMADGLRRDLKETGVGVSIFCPGLVNTQIWNSRANRQEQYGGAAQLPAEVAERVQSAIASHGQDPALTAQLCLEGIARDEFLIITDPKIRNFAERRHAQVAQALDTLDQRFGKFEAQGPGGTEK
ncbi:NAD(P)-dependent dehydrogenase (short-subunit alcohol dehydrogenase family) [Pseudomonas sp. JAI111]|uniref:SDR family oxidoreductase n=1 Tax=Pseudomonas sp. JAI111 TaxID=2735913 RepID=UPI0021674CA5|nr:SDR family NAD(P)-dependent oxidoreductase [Pseudomonas sp. JAI111]MCS3835692.1 NAD(P)-dependent dehydrogenase (short-subunit alcohol dehydrogenase family) [Pseudomonas sp. JAI111]